MPGHQTQGQETLVFADELCRPEGKRRQKRTWVSVRQPGAGSLGAVVQAGLPYLFCSREHFSLSEWPLASGAPGTL